MAYASKTKQLRYLAKWRKKHPTYMRDYGRKYYNQFIRGQRFVPGPPQAQEVAT